MKYINHEILGIIIFDECQSHAQIASRLGGVIISAGFVSMDAQECYGKSTTLNLCSDKDDTRHLRAAISVR